jgi:hypothetical protein
MEDAKTAGLSKDEIIKGLRSRVVELEAELSAYRLGGKKKRNVRENENVAKTRLKFLLERCAVGFINSLSYLSVKDVMSTLMASKELYEFSTDPQQR